MADWSGELWAYVSADGRVLADSAFDSEATVWLIALGWPAAAEIEAAKARGDRVIRARIQNAERK